MVSYSGKNFINYRNETLDSKSKSFCGAKWYNATIWLGHGMTTSCHHPIGQRVGLDEVMENYKAIHNTKHKKEMRQMMKDGVRPSECEYCWRIEDMDRDAVSDRVFKSIIYSDEELNKAFEAPAQKDVDLITLEIAFDRVCNFACSYCNASFSSTWGKDIAKNGPYLGMKSDGSYAYAHDGKESQPYQRDEENPYIEAFWKWWPELKQSLRELRITGGEPLMSPQVWRLLDYLEKEKNENLLFSINSNLGAKDELIDELILKSKNLKKFELYTSNESVGASAEYLRDGLNYDQWKNNVEKIVTKGNFQKIHVMMTITALSLFTMTEFLDQMVAWKEKYGMHFPNWSVNILRFPSFMSPSVLPAHLKEERRAALKEWVKRNKNNSLIMDFEMAGIERLIDYLEMVHEPHMKSSNLEMRQKDFKVFYAEYDRRRGKCFDKTFPVAVVDWLKEIV